MRELRVDINNKIATYNTRSGVIVCGNTNYKIKFTFDEEWNEFEYKTARFAWNDKYIDVVFYGDSVAVPMLSQTTMLTVGVFAGENLHTTTPAKIPCMLSILCVSDRAKEAEYYEVNGTLEYRLPAIRPEDHSKILQAVNGKYELREAPDLTMNEGMVSAALETKVKPLQNKVTELEAEIDEVKTNFGGEALRGDIDNLYLIVVGNTWLLNQAFDNEIFESGLEYEFDFISNGKHFTKIKYQSTGVGTASIKSIHYIDADGIYLSVYMGTAEGGWLNEAYRTITTDDNISLNLIATRTETELETKAKTVVGAINEIGNKVETNEADLEQLNELPAIIFKDKADVIAMANKLGIDDETIMGIIKQLEGDVNSLNKSRTQYDAEKKMLYIPIAVSKLEVEIGGLYIDWQHLKIYLEILGTTYDITDWEVVQEIVGWIQDFGEKAVVWVNGVGETIKGWIIGFCNTFGIETTLDDEEPTAESAEVVGEIIAGAVEAQKKVVSPAWKLNDTFADTNIFDYEFDFTSNSKTFSRMRSQINASDNGLQTYVIHYIWYENGVERPTTVYSSAKTGGWIDTAYQTVYACNPSASSTAILNNVAGASWRLNEKLKANSLDSFRINCDFIANNEHYVQIRVVRAEGVYSPDDFQYQYDRDKIEFCKSTDEHIGGTLVYYYHPQLNEGGWLNHISGEYDNPTSVYRDITVLTPTDHIAYQLRKIGVEVTEKLDTTAQTMAGGLNEINRYMGNLSELEVKEFTPYSMRRSVEDEEEAPEQDTLVKAINRVYRKTVAMQETIDEVDTKIYEIINGKTWVLHQNLYDYYNESFTYNFNFTSNGTRFNKMLYDYWTSDGGEPDEYRLYYYTADGTEILVCDFGGYRADWRYGEEYRTIITTDDISLEHIAVLESGKEDDAPTLVAGNNIEIIPNEEANTVEVKLADSITLKGNYPLALTKGTDEYKGYCYINPPALPSGTIDLHIPSKSGTIALLSDLEGLGGSSKAIIDVTELPTENINTNSIYRLPVGTFYFGTDKMPWICRIVETLPNEGEPATSDMESFVLYYETSSNIASGYVDTMLGEMLGIPSTWYPVEALASLLEVTYSGVVFSEKDIPADSMVLLIAYKLYQYTNDWVCINDSVGSVGSGYGAEIFNTPRNVASGDYSHAEGYLTEATNSYSHAEGNGCAASGMSSHAEGEMTAAFGHYSHSEGQETIAHGNWQHVQGKYNIQDIEERYAHIVGNGDTSNNRSNAHTIDWQGNGWFAGTVKVGGTGQDDENAKELATKEYVDSKIGGGSSPSVSLVGTWTVIENPEIPTTELYLKFISNGVIYDKIGFGTTGPDFWGIKNLRYQTQGGEYDQQVYTNNPSESYGITHGWGDYGYRTLEVIEEPTDANAIAWLGANTDAPKVELPKEEMPQIRFTSMAKNEDNIGYKFTVEIIGGGALQEGDALQICAKRMFGQTVNEDGTIKRPMKHKLRRFAEYTVTADDLDKRFLTVNVLIDLHTIPYLFFSNNKSGNALSPLYLRIRRPKGDLQNNDTGMTVDATFSNVVQVWKTYKTENLTLSLV